MDGNYIQLLDVKKWFPIKTGILSTVKDHVRAVDGVSLDIKKGETLGIVGESGCGKTTLGRVIMGLIPSTSGQIKIQGRDMGSIQTRELRKKMQIVFQDPGGSMNPRMTIKSIIGEPLKVNGVAEGAELTRRVRDLLDDVGLKDDHLTRYPHEFSGGQKQRIALARSLSVNPEFILLDEPTSALDVSVQAQVLNLLDDIQRQRNLTFVFISHSLNVVNHISDRVAVMYLGKIVELSENETLFNEPAHPYTHALLSAIPKAEVSQRDQRRVILEGDVPSPVNPPSGCRFHTRCPIAVEGKCDTDEPILVEISKNHSVACHFPLTKGSVLPQVN